MTRKRVIHRPHWKRIAQAAKRKLKEIRRANTIKARPPQQHSFNPEVFEKEILKPKLTKAQEKWYQQGFEEGLQTAQDREDRLERKLGEFQAVAARHHQRRELLKPALEIINKLMED